MEELILYRGSGRITLMPVTHTRYLYRIGSGKVEGNNFIDLNDGRRLNVLAKKIRDDYSRWIYSLNESFLSAGLKIGDLSLFFLTDLSCKRSEFFETFDFICNLLLIQERLTNVELTHARLIGIESGFERAFRSMFPETSITTTDSAQAQARPWRRLGSDGLYLLRVAGVLFVNTLMKKNVAIGRYADRTFFSIYPQMFSTDGVEVKYGDFPDKHDNYAVSILADGIHQKTSITNYARWCREAEKREYGVIDRYLKISDLALGLYWLGRLWKLLLRERHQVHLFKSIDISGLIQTELVFSISRIMRLCVLKGAFRRFLNNISTRELVYYPCEYPLGRLISWISSSRKPALVRTGFQMSIVSQRRLEQFLAPGEGSAEPPFLKHAPIPDQILAEDAVAASIYRYAGYRNVEIMEKIYRFGYLEGITPQKQVGQLLIAPGLHDGAMMLEQLRSEIAAHPHNTYLVKPHPRADNSYLDGWSSTESLQVSAQPIAELLAIVSRVFVTYSSVGMEAKYLGIDITVVDVPGRVNASPLMDLAC